MDINEYLNSNFVKLFDVMKCLEPGMHINQIISYNIPYYFKAKVNDINIIIGKNQLDALDQIISIYKNKNKEEKIDNLKKLNIQKAVTWCEKFKIPCNKFAEKTNRYSEGRGGSVAERSGNVAANSGESGEHPQRTGNARRPEAQVYRLPPEASGERSSGKKSSGSGAI